MRHDAVVGQLPVNADVLRIGQRRWLGAVLRRRVRRSRDDEQVAPGGHQVTVQHLVDQSAENGSRNLKKHDRKLLAVSFEEILMLIF